MGAKLERVMGIEPTCAAWEAAVLPLNYTRAAGKILPILQYPKAPIYAPMVEEWCESTVFFAAQNYVSRISGLLE